MNQYTLPQSVANMQERNVYQFNQTSQGDYMIVTFNYHNKLAFEIDGQAPESMSIIVDKKIVRRLNYIPQNQHVLIEIDLEQKEDEQYAHTYHIVIRADFKDRDPKDTKLILYC